MMWHWMMHSLMYSPLMTVDAVVDHRTVAWRYWSTVDVYCCHCPVYHPDWLYRKCGGNLKISKSTMIIIITSSRWLHNAVIHSFEKIEGPIWITESERYHARKCEPAQTLSLDYQRDTALSISQGESIAMSVWFTDFFSTSLYLCFNDLIKVTKIW